MAPVLALLAAAIPVAVIAAAVFGLPGLLVVTFIAVPLILYSVARARRVAAGNEMGNERRLGGGPGTVAEDLDPRRVPADLRNYWGNRGPALGDRTQTRSGDPFAGIRGQKERRRPPKAPPRTTGR